MITQLPDHDAQVFLELPVEKSWTDFVAILIHQATCKQCARSGPPELTLNVMIDGRPHVAVIGIELHAKT